MKKYFIAFALVCALCSCGSKQSQTAEPVQDSITVTMDSTVVDSVIVEHGDSIGEV